MVINSEPVLQTQKGLLVNIFDYMEKVVEAVATVGPSSDSKENSKGSALTRYYDPKGPPMDSTDGKNERGKTPSERSTRASPYSEPQTWLSSYRRDPFRSQPRNLDYEGQKLVDHCESPITCMGFNRFVFLFSLIGVWHRYLITALC
jgi:hypothetical protein